MPPPPTVPSPRPLRSSMLVLRRPPSHLIRRCYAKFAPAADGADSLRATDLSAIARSATGDDADDAELRAWTIRTWLRAHIAAKKSRSTSSSTCVAATSRTAKCAATRGQSACRGKTVRLTSRLAKRTGRSDGQFGLPTEAHRDGCTHVAASPLWWATFARTRAKVGAGGGNRTRTTLAGLRILSPVRLPVSPPRLTDPRIW